MVGHRLPRAAHGHRIVSQRGSREPLVRRQRLITEVAWPQEPHQVCQKPGGASVTGVADLPHRVDGDAVAERREHARDGGHELLVSWSRRHRRRIGEGEAELVADHEAGRRVDDLTCTCLVRCRCVRGHRGPGARPAVHESSQEQAWDKDAGLMDGHGLSLRRSRRSQDVGIAVGRHHGTSRSLLHQRDLLVTEAASSPRSMPTRTPSTHASVGVWRSGGACALRSRRGSRGYSAGTALLSDRRAQRSCFTIHVKM